MLLNFGVMSMANRAPFVKSMRVWESHHDLQFSREYLAAAAVQFKPHGDRIGETEGEGYLIIAPPIVVAA